jgi:hypothetical protein
VSYPAVIAEKLVTTRLLDNGDYCVQIIWDGGDLLVYRGKDQSWADLASTGAKNLVIYLLCKGMDMAGGTQPSVATPSDIDDILYFAKDFIQAASNPLRSDWPTKLTIEAERDSQRTVFTVKSEGIVFRGPIPPHQPRGRKPKKEAP